MFTLLRPVHPIFCLMSNRKLMGKGCFLRSPYWTCQVIACFRPSPGAAASKSLSGIQIHGVQLQDAVLSWFTQGNFNYITHLSFSVAPLNLGMQRLKLGPNFSMLIGWLVLTKCEDPWAPSDGLLNAQRLSPMWKWWTTTFFKGTTQNLSHMFLFEETN